jgi:hypothetical protein
LCESEERLKHAERIAHVGHWYWDLKANRVSWSQEIVRILGRPQDYEPSYKDSLEIVLPQDRDRVEQWLRDCLAEKRGNSIEVRIARPNDDCQFFDKHIDRYANSFPLSLRARAVHGRCLHFRALAASSPVSLAVEAFQWARPAPCSARDCADNRMARPQRGIGASAFTI